MTWLIFDATHVDFFIFKAVAIALTDTPDFRLFMSSVYAYEASHAPRDDQRAKRS